MINKIESDVSTTYSIRELADEFDTTTRSIRFYEDKGLLQPERRGQTRIYAAKDRVAMKLISRGKRLGLSLAESKQLIDMYSPSANKPQLEKFLQVIIDRRQQLQQQMLDIEMMMTELDEAEERCQSALSPIKN